MKRVEHVLGTSQKSSFEQEALKLYRLKINQI